MQQTVQVVVAGHICFDIIPSFRGGQPAEISRLFVPGKLINMGGAKLSTGGPVSNTGLALSTLGIRTRLMGKIGNDCFGEIVLKLLRERGAADGMIVADGEETSYTIVIVPPGLDRIFLHNPGANNTFGADDIDYGLVKQAQLFHFGYPPLMKRIFADDGAQLVEIFKRVKALGVTTSLDMSLPDPVSESGQVNWLRVLEELLPHVDIFLPSAEETMFMIQRESLTALHARAHGGDPLLNLDMNWLPGLGAKLLAMGTKIAVLKCGVRGYYIRTASADVLRTMGTARPASVEDWAGRELIEESYNVPVAAATGSGDSSIAGFLAAYLNGLGIEQAIRVACLVGAQNVQVLDAVSGIKGWNETMAMVAANLPKHKFPIAGNYWTWDGTHGNWVGKLSAPTEA